MTIYQFIIKREDFHESVQVYANTISEALSTVLKTEKDSDILRILKL